MKKSKKQRRERNEKERNDGWEREREGGEREGKRQQPCNQNQNKIYSKKNLKIEK